MSVDAYADADAYAYAHAGGTPLVPLYLSNMATVRLYLR